MPDQFHCRVYVSTPSEVSVDEDNLFHVTDTEGGMVIERIFEPYTLRASAERALRTVDDWENRRNGR